MRRPDRPGPGADRLIVLIARRPTFAPPEASKFIKGVKDERLHPGLASEGVKYLQSAQATFARKPRKRGGPINFMKKLCLVLIALSCLSALAAGQAAGQVVEEIITRVNNQIITRSEFERSKDQLKDEVKQQDPKDPDKAYAEREKDILRDLIDQQLLLDKGKDLGITGDTDLIKRLDQMRKDMKLDSLEDLEKEATKQGVSWEDFKQNMRNQIITQKVIGEEVGGHLSITKEEEQKFYDEHKSEMEQPEYIRLSEILVAPKPRARRHHSRAADPSAAGSSSRAAQAARR